MNCVPPFFSMLSLSEQQKAEQCPKKLGEEIEKLGMGRLGQDEGTWPIKGYTEQMWWTIKMWRGGNEGG